MKLVFDGHDLMRMPDGPAKDELFGWLADELPGKSCHRLEMDDEGRCFALVRLAQRRWIIVRWNGGSNLVKRRVEVPLPPPSLLPHSRFAAGDARPRQRSQQ